MTPPNVVFATFLLLSGLICLMVVIVLWLKSWKAPGAKPLTVMMLALFWWDVTYAVFWADLPAPMPYFWLDITMVGAYIVPSAFLVFSLEFSQMQNRLGRPTILALFIEPFLALILQWTDPWHNLYFGGNKALNTTSIFVAGPAYWFNVYYSYALMLIAVVILAVVFFRASGMYRRQTGLVLAATIVPWVANILAVSGLGINLKLDVTPFIFTFTAVVIAFGLVRYRLLDIVPIAHSLLLENMSEGVVVLDLKDRVVEINPIAAQYLNSTLASAFGEPVEKVFADWPAVVNQFKNVDQAHVDILADEEQQIFLDFRISPLLDTKKQKVGRLVVWRDISQLKQAQKAVVDALEFNKTIVDSSPIGIVIYKTSGACVSANAAAARIVGTTPQNLLQDDLGETTGWIWMGSDLYEAARLAIHSQQPVNKQIYMSSPYGKELWLDTISAPFTSGGEVHLLLMFVDDSERQKAAAALLAAHAQLEQRVQERTMELQTANLALEKALRAKDEFLAAMSHELRTPLTGILGLSEVLQYGHYGSLTDKQLSAVRTIEKSGRRLQELINDVLDFSQIQSGKIELNLSICSLNSLCSTSLQNIEGMAQEKGQQVTFVAATENIMLRCDERRIRQVVTNLLSNAVKFTPDHGCIELKVEPSAADEQVKISVIDNGIGIKEEDFERLFLPFVQIDARLSRLYSGTGLGLALVKALVELHGGHISVDSVFGEGSSFTVTLPWQG